MRVRPVWIVAVAVGGCDVVLGLGEPGQPAPGPVAPPRCLVPGDYVEMPLLADTYLVDGDPLPRGGEPLTHLGGGALVLLRFDAGDVAFDEVQLKLTAPTHAVGCGAPGECAPCTSATGGTFAVHRARPDWEERAATYTSRTSAEAWSTPGVGGEDRSTVAGQASLMGTTLTAVLPSFPAGSAVWPRGLAIMVTSDAGGETALLGAREAMNSCGTTPAPQLIARCTVASSCGDMVVDPTETCDDGNPSAGDGCSDACQRESVCGDGLLEPPEQCDDTNTVGGDGCSSACTFEASCGNGFPEVGETCDDGNVLAGDGCSPSCTLERTCGDKVIQLGEECDDGNTASFDGCSKTCQCEGECLPGWDPPSPI